MRPQPCHIISDLSKAYSWNPSPPASPIRRLSERPREVFRHLVEAFLASGEPVGSRTLSQRLPLTLSPASIRNVMADLEAMGLLYAPHTSAGRVPTEKGLRLFVDGLLEIGELAPDERGRHRGAHVGQRPAHRRCADPGDPVAGGPVALRRADGDRQAGCRPQACRIRRRGARARRW